MSKMLDAALKYQEKGFSVIPVRQDKKPLIKWEQYQKRRATREEILEWWKKNPEANIGLVTGEISNLLVVDSDTKEATEKVESCIPEGLVVPCQKTPKDGRHFFFSHEEGFVNRARVADGIDVRTSGGYVVVAPSVNGIGKGWEWLASVLDFELPSIALDLKTLINNSFSLYRESLTPLSNADLIKSARVSTSQHESAFWESGRRDEDLIHAAFCLQKGGSEPAFTDNILNIIVNSWGEDDPKWVAAKVKSAWDRAAKRERNIAQELRDWVNESAKGQFRVSEYQKESAVVSKQDKHALIVALKKLCEKGIVEKTGNRTGEYRIIEQDVEFMDYKNVSKEGSIDLILPLDVHKKTIFFPRNVIVLAGVTGYGKTSYLLNVIRTNMNKFRFIYFASEMSNLALNYKLNQFSLPINDWKMDVVPDYKWDHLNIHDKIFPDDMNVIDYLEPEGDKSYHIHDVITKIIKRLRNGMALIATQKRPGADLSAGGVYSAKASSLYLSLDWGSIFIFKNRFREEDVSPKLTRRDFDIVSGQQFIPKGEWYDPNEKRSKDRYKSFLKED